MCARVQNLPLYSYCESNSELSRQQSDVLARVMALYSMAQCNKSMRVAPPPTSASWRGVGFRKSLSEGAVYEHSATEING